MHSDVQISFHAIALPFRFSHVRTIHRSCRVKIVGAPILIEFDSTRSCTAQFIRGALHDKMALTKGCDVSIPTCTIVCNVRSNETNRLAARLLNCRSRHLRRVALLFVLAIHGRGRVARCRGNQWAHRFSRRSRFPEKATGSEAVISDVLRRMSSSIAIQLLTPG